MYIDNNRITRAGVNQRILSACDFYSSSLSANWIDDLKANCIAQKQKHTSALLSGDEHHLQQALINNIDIVMDTLRSFSLMFNKDADYELFLTVTAPLLEYEAETNITSYRGRISSRNWSLVVASKEKRIQFILLPSSHLLHGSAAHSEQHLLMELHVDTNNDKLELLCENKQSEVNDISELAKEAFKILVEAIFSDIDANPQAALLNQRHNQERRQAHERRKSDQSWIGLGSVSQGWSLIERRREENDRRSRTRRELADQIMQASESRENEPGACPLLHDEECFSAEPSEGQVAERLLRQLFDQRDNREPIVLDSENEDSTNSEVIPPSPNPLSELILEIVNGPSMPSSKLLLDKEIVLHEPVLHEAEMNDSTDGTRENNPSSTEQLFQSTVERVEKQLGSKDKQMAANEIARFRSNSKSVTYMNQKGERTMNESLSSVIMNSLDELVDQEEDELNKVIQTGSQLFLKRAFEQVELCLREAQLRRRSSDLLSGLRAQWNELCDLEEFGRLYGDDIEHESPDQTLGYCSATRRLRVSVETLMKTILQIGASSFESKDFDRAQNACKHAIKLQKFQQRVDEICADDDASSHGARTIDIEIAA